MKFRKPWFLLVVAALVVGLGYAVYAMILRPGDSYLTISQVRAQATVAGEQHLVVKGKVAPGSIEQDGTARILRFALTDGKENLRVVYQGIVPDYFKPGVELVLVGKYRADGFFETSNIGRPGSLCNTCH